MTLLNGGRNLEEKEKLSYVAVAQIVASSATIRKIRPVLEKIK